MLVISNTWLLLVIGYFFGMFVGWLRWGRRLARIRREGAKLIARMEKETAELQRRRCGKN